MALFLAELQATFKGELRPDQELAFREHLGWLPHEAARVGVARLVADPAYEQWVPAPGELLRGVRAACGDQAIKAWRDGYASYAEWVAAFYVAWEAGTPLPPGPLRRELTA